jgi:hypothetical protein
MDCRVKPGNHEPSDGSIMTVFTPHQDAALEAVAGWLKGKPARGAPHIFRLFGYAGTGKTTLAKHIARHVDGKVLFGAFTGKAASVMRSKGCEAATTIHGMIYQAHDSGEATPSFDLWHEGPAAKAKLIVIDECSMVDAELGRDLLSFGVPLLVLGDPAQLPPIHIPPPDAFGAPYARSLNASTRARIMASTTLRSPLPFYSAAPIRGGPASTSERREP